MSTTKTRINISLPNDIKTALVRLAKRDEMPTATKAERLLELALEIEEDQLWEQIAAKRDTKNAQWIPHEEAWQ